MLLNSLYWRSLLHKTQLLVNQHSLFPEAGHPFTQVKIFEVGASLRTNEFLFLIAFINAFEVSKVNLVKVGVVICHI